jgi:hypothetical protein
MCYVFVFASFISGLLCGVGTIGLVLQRDDKISNKLLAIEPV